MAHAAVNARLAGALWLVTTTAACAGSPPPSAPMNQEREASAAPAFAGPDASWGTFRSKRFQLAVRLPEGRAWQIDDRSRPWLFASHAGTASRLRLIATEEDRLVNRELCELRARALGWVPASSSRPLTTVEDAATALPPGYDSRAWVAVDASDPAGALEGHVFLFGASLRRCLLVHFVTQVASARDEPTLAARLAVARERVVGGLVLDAPRTTVDARVPRAPAAR